MLPKNKKPTGSGSFTSDYTVKKKRQRQPQSCDFDPYELDVGGNPHNGVYSGNSTDDSYERYVEDYTKNWNAQ